MPVKVEMIVKSRGPWLTLAEGGEGPRVKEQMADLGRKDGLAAAIQDGMILDIGEMAAIEKKYVGQKTLDFGFQLVMPGFVDPHTHPVFADTREMEFEMRCGGKTYVEIAKAGGGIRSSVRALRHSGEEELEKKLRDRADRFIRLGTTTIEAKSGYGLSLDDEMKSLRVIKKVRGTHPLDMTPTFMGAHEIPDEYRERREDYIQELITKMIPAVAAEHLAEYCDVFCEAHVFTVEESRRILEAAKKVGLAGRVHADEIEDTGGAALAADVGAVSADHLVAVSDHGIERLREAGVIPILLPGTSFFLRLEKRAPARKMIDRGLPVALATDFNPGSCPIPSMPTILGLAMIAYGMTAAETITAATVNAAHALRLGHDRGILAPGYRADLIVLDVKTPQAIPYHLGDNRVTAVVKNGALVAGAEQKDIKQPPPGKAFYV